MADTMAEQVAKARAKTVAHGFDIMLGTAEDVAKAGELGAFAGLKTKSELEKEFTAWIAAQPGNLVADFLAHLKRRAQDRLDGMGPKPAKGIPVGDQIVTVDERGNVSREAKAALLESIAEEERREQEPAEPDEFGD